MRALIFKLLRLFGLPFIWRELLQRNKVSILLFHDISKETAEVAFKYLAGKYNLIHLNDFIRACENKDLSGIPKKALIITFDDGHIRNYEMLPVIKKLNIPITIFLCASLIDTNRHFWFNFKQSSFSSLELKHKSNRERLQALSTVGFEQDKEFDTRQAMTKEQINEMKDLVDMQAHTLFHPCLPRCSEAEAREEIFKSKEKLENEYELNINTIAYPNGDYSDRDIMISKEAGYTCGVTVDAGFNTIDTDLFRLKRLSMSDSFTLDELAVKASGVWSFFSADRRKKNNFGWTKNVEP